MYLVSFIDLLLWKGPLLPVFECVELRINYSLHVCLDKCLNKGKTEKRCRFDTVCILDLQAFLEKMAGSVEIAFENEFVEIQHANASDRKCNSFFLNSELLFSFVASGFSRGKRKARLHIKCLWKISFLLYCVPLSLKVCLMHSYYYRD